MALQESNARGFLKFDSKRARFIAPICEATRQPFKGRIEKAQAAFITISARRERGLDCDMALFDSSSRANFLQGLHRLFKEFSRNVRNQSLDDNPLGNLNMNLQP
jgi:hypothetical protein